VFASLEMSSLLEHLHLDVSVLHQNQNQSNNKSKSHDDSSGATTTSTTPTPTTTTTPDRMATLQAYLDWHVRLNTVRRCLVERDCQVQSVQSKSTRSRRFLAYQQQQQQQQQLSVSMPMPDNGAGPLHAVTSAIMTMEAPALATETAAVMDAAVVVLKDWWRATHRPDLPQYQYQYQYCIPETETETGISAYPPTTATGIDKNGAAAESQRSLGVVGPTSLQQKVASNAAN
jgi:hypothetical protein